MDLKTLGELTEIDNRTYYFAKNYAAAATPFMAFSPSDNLIEINGRDLPVHSELARIPLSVDGAALDDISVEPSIPVAFSHAGKCYTITAYLGSQKYTPPQSWQWSFRWSEQPPYYLPAAAIASFNATPKLAVCGDMLIVWLNEAGQLLGLPAAILAATAEAGNVETIMTKVLESRGAVSFFILNHTPTGVAYETVRLCTPPLTADDVHTFCSLGSARYCYLSKGGSLMPIEISGSFSWSAVGTGECATFSAKIYSKNVTYVNG